MYEVRPEGSFLRVDSDTSLARAVSKAEQLAALNNRRYVVVQVVSVHVAEPNLKYIQMVGRGNRTVTGRLRDYQVQTVRAAIELSGLSDSDREKAVTEMLFGPDSDKPKLEFKPETDFSTDKPDPTITPLGLFDGDQEDEGN